MIWDSQVLFGPFPLSQILATWERQCQHVEMKDIITLRTSFGPLPGLCGFLYPFHQFHGTTASRVHFALKDELTATFSNKSSFLMPTGSDASYSDFVNISKNYERVQ